MERDSLLAAEQATADSLAEQNAQLRELDRMKDQLVSSVSHELRTPLTSIGGYTEMLLGREFGELNDDQQDFVEVIDRNCRRLNRIIDDILFVARVDAGRLSLERSWVDLAEVAAASVEAARPRARQGQVTIELTAPDDLEPVWADQTRLTQMFDNLISNAVKFTPPGGTITVTLSGAEDMVSAQIADTGIGIPPGRGRPAVREVLPRLDGRCGRRDRARAEHREVHRGGPRRDDRGDQRRGGRHDVHGRAAGPPRRRRARPRRRLPNEHGRRRRPSR